MLNTNSALRSILAIMPLLMLVPCGAAVAHRGMTDENLIPNGDFSKGNTGFESELPYTKPAFNCLWGGYYTVATVFNNPQLHKLIAPEGFPVPSKRTGNERSLFANAGGTEPLVVWSTEIKCQPNTRYLLSFNCMSLTGYMVDGNPPHQVSTLEWSPEFEISANEDASFPIQAGLGKYYKGSMLWDSKRATSATIKIVRTKFPHGGGLIGISDIRMISKGPTKTFNH